MIYYCDNPGWGEEKGHIQGKTRKKIQHQAAYALLGYGLKKEYGFEEIPLMERNEYGKPFFFDFPQIHFNLSHCDEGVLCAVSKEEVGVDMERRLSYRAALAERICHERELAVLMNAGETKRAALLTRLWTAKESYLKYTGQGLRAELKELCFDEFVQDEFQALDCYFKIWGGDAYRICICSPQPIPSCIRVDWAQLCP